MTTNNTNQELDNLDLELKEFPETAESLKVIKLTKEKVRKIIDSESFDLGGVDVMAKSILDRTKNGIPLAR